MADDTKKIREEIKKSADELAGQIKESSKELKPKFQEMVKNIAEVNGPLAKSVAELRNTSKDTFAGALQAKKLASMTSVVDKYLTKGREALDEKELETLRKSFMDTAEGAFNINDLKKIQDKIQGIETTFEGLLQTEESLISEREALLNRQLAGDTKLAEIENEIARQREIMARTNGAVQQRAAKKEQELLRQREEEASVVTSGIDSRLALVQAERQATEEQLKIEKETRDDYNDKLKSVLEDATNFEGLNKFSDDLKELTGLDIAGGLDNITKKVMSFVGVMKALGTGLTTAAVALKGVIVKVAVAAASFVTSLLLGAASMLLAALPILGAVALIALAGYGIYKAGEYLWEKKDEFMEYISETWESIKMWISELGEKVIGFFTMVGDYWMEKWDELTAWLGEDSDGPIGFIKDIINFVVDYYSTIFQGVKDFFSSVSENGIVETISEIFDMISEKISGMVNKVKGFFGFGGDEEEELPLPTYDDEPTVKKKPDKASQMLMKSLEEDDTIGDFNAELDAEEERAKKREKPVSKSPGTPLQKALQPEPTESGFEMASYEEDQARRAEAISKLEGSIAGQGDETPDWKKKMDQETLAFLKENQAETEAEYNARRDKRQKEFEEQQNRVKAVEEKSLGVKNKAVEDESKYRKFTDEQLTERAKELDAAEAKVLEMKANAADENELSRANENLEIIAYQRKKVEEERLKPIKGQEIDIQSGPRAKMSGENIALASTEAAEAKDANMSTGNAAIQNVVGGTTVNNTNTTKIMGRPSVWDDDRTVSKLNQSDW